MRQFNRIFVATALFIIVVCCRANAQASFIKYQELFTTPNQYIVNHTEAAPVIDGDIEDRVWQTAAWTSDFVDIGGGNGPHPPLQTNVKMLWDDGCLYFAAKISDPNVWATLTKHDEIIFHDNDFEVFIDPHNTGQQYFEIEHNAFNTVFDLFMNKPYRNGGIPLINWDVKGLRSAVKVQGTINDPSDKDTGWTLEIAIPFKALSAFGQNPAPKENTTWRINFSRVEWDTKIVDGKYVKLKDSTGRLLPEHNWVWSPQGIINMHYPERWGYLIFNGKDTAVKSAAVMQYSELQKRYLWLVYYQQADEWKAHGRYEQSLKNLGDKPKVYINGRANTLSLEATKHQFIVLITDDNDHITRTLNQDGLVGQLKQIK